MVQQHVSKYYARRHPPLTLGVKIQLFLEHGHVAYQKELGMQQHGSRCGQRYNKKETSNAGPLANSHEIKGFL